MARAGEHDATGHHLTLNDIDEQLTLVLLLDKGDVLFNAVGCSRFRTDVHPNGVVQHRRGQRTDGIGHGRTEQQILSSVGHEVQNALHVVAEAHIQHAVRFVENEMRDFAQVHVTLVVEIEQTTGCRHQQVHPTAQGLHLRRLPYATENHR